MSETLYVSRWFNWSTPGQRSDITGPIEIFYSYLDQAYQQLTKDFGFNIDEQLPIHVTIMPSIQCQGAIGGSASNGNLGLCAGNWADNHWCNGLLIQELVNMFTGRFGGWPTEWWADGHSPFPIMVATLVMRETCKTKQATDHYNTFKNDYWFQRFWRLHAFKGWPLWRSLFNLFQAQNVDLHQLAEPLKSGTVMAYINFLALTQ